jgi:uncharacterized protein
MVSTPSGKAENNHDSMTYSLITALFGVFAASILRGFTGFGFGLASVPLLSLALPPAQVVPLVVVLQVLIGVLGLKDAAKQCDWRAVTVLFPGLVLGVPIGLLILTTLPPNPVRLVIGAVLLLSVGLIAKGARLPPNPSRLLSGGVGVASGIINGLASMGGPPIIVYLLAIGHSTARLRATSIIYFMLAALVTAVPMTWRGLITRDILIWSAASIPALFIGSRLGTWAFHRARPAHHKATALLVLTVLGVVLIGRALLS